eukprot:gene27766-36593_t
MQPKQASFHRIMLIITVSLLFLLFASSSNGVLFRRTNLKRVNSKKIVALRPLQSDLPTEESTPPIFSEHADKKSSRDQEKFVGAHIEVTRFSEFRSSAFVGEEISNTIPDDLKPAEIRSKLTNDVVELFLNELFRGLLDCNSVIPIIFSAMSSFGGCPSSTVQVRGFLVDLSMSMWLALQNHFRYKQRSNWQCGEDNCELMDETQSDSASVDGSERQSLLLSSGTVVSFLIPMDDAAAPVPTPLSSGLRDAGSSDISPDVAGGDVAAGTGPLQSMPAFSAPLASPVAIAKYCATSLLIHLVSHQVAPFVMHSIEDCLGQLAVAVA